MKWKKFYIIFLIPIFFTACLESPEMTIGVVNGKEKPTVETTEISRLFPVCSDGSLVFQGVITSIGKAEIIERGFYWSTTSNDPGINDSIIQFTANADTFKYVLANASGEKTYYWKAYAKNKFGYDYGLVDSCQTPFIWREKNPSLPPESRGYGVVFILQNNIYITCGIKSGGGPVFVDDMWAYNLTSSSWSQADSMSFIGSNRINPVVFTIGNFAFVGTGRQTSGLPSNDFYQFDSNLKKWTQITTPNDFTSRYQAAAFSLNDKGYVVCGHTAELSVVLNDVWQYDIANNLWKRMNDFPDNFYGGISISDNNRSFVGFGQDSESSKTLWEYDSITDSWTEFATLSDDIKIPIYSGVIIQNTIYILDGVNQIWALNMSDKSWKKKSLLPLVFKNEYGETVNQLLLTTGTSNSIYVGLRFSNYLYEYQPLWDN